MIDIVLTILALFLLAIPVAAVVAMTAGAWLITRKPDKSKWSHDWEDYDGR